MNEWSEVMETTRFSRRGCSVTGPDPATRSDDECEHDCHEHNVPGPADRIAGLNQEGEHEPEPGVRPKCRSNQRELVPWPHNRCRPKQNSSTARSASQAIPNTKPAQLSVRTW
jgi:hypothetical protein